MNNNEIIMQVIAVRASVGGYYWFTLQYKDNCYFRTIVCIHKAKLTPELSQIVDYYTKNNSL